MVAKGQVVGGDPCGLYSGNVLVFWMLTLVPGVTIDGFFAALWSVLIVSIMGGIIDMIMEKKD